MHRKFGWVMIVIGFVLSIIGIFVLPIVDNGFFGSSTGAVGIIVTFAFLIVWPLVLIVLGIMGLKGKFAGPMLFLVLFLIIPVTICTALLDWLLLYKTT